MRKSSSDFKTSFISEIGTAATNKDYFAFMELDDYACYVMANGIDSDEEKQSADIVANSIFSDFEDNPTISKGKIIKILKNANKQLNYESKKIRLKVSILVLITDYSKYIWLSAGNVRLYHFRNDNLLLKSKDQSVSQLLADAGKISEDNMGEHAERNNLISYMGKQTDFKPFVSGKQKLMDGDVLLIGTVGFWEKLKNSSIVKALKNAEKPEEFLDEMEEELLSKQKRVINNYTMATIFADKVFLEVKKKDHKIIKVILPILISLCMIGATIGFYVYRQNHLRSSSRLELSKHECNGDQFIQGGYYEDGLNEYKEAETYVKNAQDKQRGVELDNKSKITQLVIDGDKSFASQDYTSALTSYQKARKEADRLAGYDKKELDKRIVKDQNCIQVQALMKQADSAMANKDPSGAKALYQKAKDLADKSGDKADEKDIDSGISDANAKIDQSSKDQQGVQALNLENQGDQFYHQQKYNDAIEKYTMAQQIYQQLNDSQRTYNIGKKIEDAQNMLNPLPTQPKSNSGTQGSNSGQTPEPAANSNGGH